MLRAKKVWKKLLILSIPFAVSPRPDVRVASGAKSSISSVKSRPFWPAVFDSEKYWDAIHFSQCLLCREFIVMV